MPHAIFTDCCAFVVAPGKITTASGVKTLAKQIGSKRGASVYELVWAAGLGIQAAAL